MAWWSRKQESAPADSRVAVLEAQVATLKESMLDASYDPDLNLPSSGGGSPFFRRLSATERDFDGMTQERQLATARWLLEANPLARRIVGVVRDFVLGDGVDLRAQDDDDGIRDAMQAVLDAFWQHPANNMDVWLHDLVQELGVDGELCLSAQVNEKDGSVLLGHIDVSEITNVLLDRRDQRTPVVVVARKPGTPNQVDYFRVIGADLDPTSKTFGRLVPYPDGDTLQDPRVNSGEATPYAGSVFLWRVNAPTGARRGRSDLLSVADWIDGVDQHLFGELDRAALMKAFVWDVTGTGMDETALTNYQKKNGAPKPGSVRYHNEKVQWNAVTPDLKTVDAQMLNDLLQSYVATGAGIPKTWVNGLMDANRATATEMGEPAIKALTMRQRYVRACLMTLGTFVLDQAELAGRLSIPRDLPDSVWPKAWKFAVQMPEIRQKDLAATATTAQQMVQALTTALVDHAIDIETYQEVMALLVGQIGIDVDLEQMRQRIEDAKAEADAQAQMAPYPAEPDMMQSQPQPAGATA